MRKQAKFGIGIAIIVVSMASLAWLGYGESKTVLSHARRDGHAEGFGADAKNAHRRHSASGQYSSYDR